ncbi:glycosyltransferase, partial [Candidatus Poribacteria bacterium]|nr:glycosyltransferase [Candidatus Poribacteria bacterium]
MRPDQVQKFLQNAKQKGFVKTYKKAIDRLDSPTPLGYSCSGRVVEVGRNIDEFQNKEKRIILTAGKYVSMQNTSKLTDKSDLVRAMKVIMPDIMKVEYNVRVLQEAETLRNVGHDVVVVGFSNKSKKRNFTITGIPIVSFYLHDGRKGVSKLIRYATAFKMILGINFYVIFQKADVYHAHNFHVLPACWFSALMHGGKLIYDTHESWTIRKNRKYHPEHIFAFI